MAPLPIPEDIRRFVLTSIASVPHLEALLLLRMAEGEYWDDARLAKRLYISEKVAHALMTDLCRAGMIEPDAAVKSAVSYRFQPGSVALREAIDKLAELYTRQLVEITHLIHSKLDRKAQQFADAFTWRKKDF